MAHTIKVTVNGVSHEAEVEPRVLLVHYLRMYGSPEPTSVRHKSMRCMYRTGGWHFHQVVHHVCRAG